MAESGRILPGPEPALDGDLRLTLEDTVRTGARIKVVGVGGGGSNAVGRMVAGGVRGVDFIVANTDAQALAQNEAPVRLQIGTKVTSGLGAGADPNIGRQAALEDTEQLIAALSGADMVFVTAGLGGGTGTGAAPVVAALASELGALTIAVVTKPFKFEGKRRAVQAERGLDELRASVDTVIAIPNERLLGHIEQTTSLTDAFLLADDVLHQAIRGISDLILVPGMINLDFADVKTIMSGMGMAIMGTGYGEGKDRSVDAANRAIASPLIEEARVEGARGVIVNITGGSDLSMLEVSQATTIIHEAAHEEANIIFGAVIDPSMEGKVKITVIATDFEGLGSGSESPSAKSDTPVDLQQYAHLRQEENAPPMAVAAAGGGGITMSRRASIEFSPALDPIDAGADDDPAGDEGKESEEQPDPVPLPAFLRPPVE